MEGWSAQFHNNNLIIGTLKSNEISSLAKELKSSDFKVDDTYVGGLKFQYLKVLNIAEGSQLQKAKKIIESFLKTNLEIEFK